MQPNLLWIDTALITARTVTRRFREGDGAAFHRLFLDNSTYLDADFPNITQRIHSPEDAEYWVRQQLANWLEQRAFSFAVWEKEQAEMIGWVCLDRYEAERRLCELTGFIDRDLANQGLMTEVLSRLLQFAFEQLHLEKVRLRVAADNYAAHRLARKCGFQREGDLRSEGHRPSGEFFDLTLFGFTHNQYYSP